VAGAVVVVDLLGLLLRLVAAVEGVVLRLLRLF
jgi:hypothetical protein